MRLDGNGTAAELDHLFPSWALSFCSVTWMEPFILCIFLLCFLSAPGSSYISQPSIPFPENILLRPVFQKERAVTLCRGEFRSRIRSGMYTLNTPCLKGSDQISRSVVSDSLWPHKSQLARPPCPTPTPGVHWDSRPSSQWCYPAISSSVVPFSSCPQSLPASES